MGLDVVASVVGWKVPATQVGQQSPGFVLRVMGGTQYNFSQGFFAHVTASLKQLQISHDVRFQFCSARKYCLKTGS